MDTFDEDENCTRLKSALDISELRNPQSQGVEFELDEDSLNTHETEQETDVVKSFEKNKVAANICLISDDEDEDDVENLSDGTEYLTEMERLQLRMKRIEGSDVTPEKDGGVLKQLKTHGVGNVIPEGALVKIHYNAYTDVGQPPFDSTRLRREPKKVRLGKGENIPGLEIALLTMKKDEHARFLFRHDYAYGNMGCPPRIPAQATLIFDIEVIHFVGQEGVDDYYSLTPEERRSRLEFKDIKKVVTAENDEAKEYFSNKHYQKAFGKYKKSANILENYNLKSEEEERQWKSSLLKVYVNLAICCNHLKHFGRTISYCNLAIDIDKANLKAHFFKGKALHGLGKFEDAKVSLTRARNLKPDNTAVSSALQSLAKSIKDYEAFEKDMYKKMFATPAFVSPQQDSNEDSSSEKKKEEKAGTQEDTSTDHGTCSPAFRALVKEEFEKFKNDSSMTDMPFPQIQMTPAEIECILETAMDLGMDVKKKGTGNSLRFEVYKKTATPE